MTDATPGQGGPDGPDAADVPASKTAPWMAWGTGTDGRPDPAAGHADPSPGREQSAAATGATPPFSSEAPGSARGSRRVAAIFAVALVAIATLVAWQVLAGGDGEEPPPVASTPPTTPEVAQPRELAAATAEDQLGQGHVALKVTRPQLLRTRPAADGQLVAKVGRKTPYGGQVILPILKARGDWVAVVSPYRKNNRVAWTKVQPNAKFVAVEYSVAIRVNDRSIIVRKNGEVIRRMKAAVGQVTHPTPPGRYAVTDGLIFKRKTRGPYGCCALVLSARQTKLPRTWTGGDRIAIHGTPNKQSIGLAASLGCLRVGDEASRWLVNNVPAGTTVFVRP